MCKTPDMFLDEDGDPMPQETGPKRQISCCTGTAERLENRS
ncbi:hypothetical protein [Lentibacillus sp. CBA3610]|nr:hypothetical protein [Lentibacillus sp. CBA3610]